MLRLGTFLLLWGLSTAHAQSVVRVGFYDFPPLLTTNTQGAPDGPLRRFTETFLTQAGFSGEYKVMPSARLYAGLKSGEVELWIGAFNRPELEAYVLETRHTLAELKLNLYYPADRPTPRLPKDLSGKNLIVLSGYSYCPEVYSKVLNPKHGAIQLRTSTHQAAVELLARGRGDFLLNYERPTKSLARSDYPALKALPLGQYPVKFVISKASPKAHQLQQALDNTYIKRVYSGQSVRIEP